MTCKGETVMRNSTAEPMSEAECWALLRDGSIGHLGLSIRALPTILPVQYYIEDGSVAICLGHHDVPAQSLAGTVAAFSTDAINPADRLGWSVHVLGTIDAPSYPDDCGQPSPGQIVRLQPRVITGQRLQVCPMLSR